MHTFGVGLSDGAADERVGGTLGAYVSLVGAELGESLGALVGTSLGALLGALDGALLGGEGD